MNQTFNCNYCNKKYIQEKRYLNHLKLHPIDEEVISPRAPAPTAQFICQYCGYVFKHQSSLSRHENFRCQGRSSDIGLKEQMINMEKQIKELQEKQKIDKQKTQEEIEELKKNPKINNQTINCLQLVCIGSNDNYLDMLTEEWGNFDKALEYVKDCALSHVRGDCQLIEKIYSRINQEFPIKFTNKSKTQIEYLDENQLKVNDNIQIFGKKLANNLQNSYLKGINHLITTNLNNRLCPNKFLEEYDLQIWNQHIFDLSDYRYQKKIINHLNIPIKSL